jgi:hypothetical protein
VPGLTLSSGGVLSGTPTTAGSFPITVQVQDNPTNPALQQTDSTTVTVTINAIVTGFTGAYVLQNWTASGPGTASITPPSGASASAAFAYSVNPAGFSPVTWTFQTTAAATGTVTFNYTYSGLHAWFEVTAFFKAFAGGSGGTTTVTAYSAGPADCCTTPSNGFNVSGTVSIAVTQGHPFGFMVGGSNFDFNNFLHGTLTITNFVAPGQ